MEGSTPCRVCEGFLAPLMWGEPGSSEFINDRRIGVEYSVNVAPNGAATTHVRMYFVRDATAVQDLAAIELPLRDPLDMSDFAATPDGTVLYSFGGEGHKLEFVFRSSTQPRNEWTATLEVVEEIDPRESGRVDLILQRAWLHKAQRISQNG